MYRKRLNHNQYSHQSIHREMNAIIDARKHILAHLLLARQFARSFAQEVFVLSGFISV